MYDPYVVLFKSFGGPLIRQTHNGAVVSGVTLYGTATN